MYPIPILFAHVIPAINYTNTEEEDPFIEYLSTGALVGALEGSGSFKRFDRPMSCSICGRPEAVIKALRTFILESPRFFAALFIEPVWSYSFTISSNSCFCIKFCYDC